MRKNLSKKFVLRKSTVSNLDRQQMEDMKGGRTTTRYSGFQFVCDSQPENTCLNCGGGGDATNTCGEVTETSCYQIICMY